MKHVIILAHPNSKSFNAAVADTYAGQAMWNGDDVVTRDLYQLGFDPVLKAEEIPTPDGIRPGSDVLREREILTDADVIILVYPLWLNTPPAILKGYLERVLGYNFAYKHGKDGMEPLLRGKKLLSFSSSGAPEEWIRKTGDFHSLRSLFDAHIANMCGFEVIDHIHFGGLNALTRPDVIERHLETVRHAARHTHPFFERPR